MSDTKVRRCLTLTLVAFVWGVLSCIQDVKADVDGYACQYKNCAYPTTDFHPAENATYSADYKRACNNPQSTEEADLCQQWRMAEATDNAAEIAADQFNATIIEIGFLLLTVAATAWAANAASKAAEATQRGVEATERSIRQSQEALASQQRPWIAQKGVSPASGLKWGQRAVDLQVKIQLENTGRTPATNIDLCCRVHMKGERPLIEHYRALADAVRDRTSGRGVALFPGEKILLAIKTSGDLKPIMDHLDRIRSGAPASFDVENAKAVLPQLYLIGCITYDFADQEKIGQTGLIATINRQPMEAGGPIGPDFGDIELDELVIDVMPEYRNIAT